MRVLMLNTRFPVREGITHIPLVMAYPAAVLQNKGHKIVVIDLAVERYSQPELRKKIFRLKPGLIVINSETTVLQTRDYCYAIKLAQGLNAAFPQIPITLMGAHVTFRDIETLKRHRCISYVIRYEADYVLNNLVMALENRLDLGQVKGLTYRKNKKVMRNQGEPPIVNLDKLPAPARKLFPILKYLKKDPETIVQGSRGCHNRCFFCQSSVMDRRLRFWSIDRVLADIEEVLSLGFTSVYFTDYDFGARRDRVMEICRRIKQKKIDFQWACNIRADKIQNTREGRSMLKLMKEAGCYRAFVGFESISPKILQGVNKKITPSILHKTVKLLKSYGIELHASFLFGLPGDTADTIKATVAFAKKINPEMVSFNLITPFPGTALGDYSQKFGINVIDPQWYEKTTLVHRNIAGNRYLSAAELQRLGSWAYKEFLSK